jgi:hypothetical protein
MTRIDVHARLCAAAFCLMVARGVHAQIRTAEIVGSVTDSSGAVVSGASVTVSNLDTNEQRTAMSASGGHFLFTLLLPGRYAIRAELAGFKAWSVPEVTLAAGDRLTLDPRLEVGPTSETVNIVAGEPILHRQFSTMAVLVDERAVQDLPLNGRNFVALAQLAPGAANTTIGFSQGGLDDRRLSSQLTVNGQYSWANNHMIDGMDNNERFIGTILVKPSVEAVHEMRIQTNLYSAEIGRTAGGVVNVITKSGTNTLHGSVYDFIRHQQFDAKGLFDAQKLPYRHSQLGGSVGGPLRRNHAFFFADYERLSVTQGQNFVGTVPTRAMIGGNFAGVARIFDPLTTVCAGNSCARTEFADAQIPMNRIDPVARRILALYPEPTNDQLANNYVTSGNRTLKQHTADGRLDIRMSESGLLFGRYSYAVLKAYQPAALAFGGSSTSDQESHGAQLNYVHTISDRALVEYRGGWSRYKVESLPNLYGQRISEDLGIRNANFNQLSSGLAQLSPNGYLGLGSGTFVPLFNTNDVFQGGVVVSRQRAAHTMKFGIEGRQRLVAQAQSSSPRGSFSFNQALTQDNPLAPGAGTGNSIATLMLGYPTAVSRSAQTIDPKYRFAEVDLFIQDDWRATNRLTLNIGIRYDYYGPLSEAHDQIANFDFNTGRIIVAGQNGTSKTGGVRKDLLNLAPRFGFAATVNDNTVVRGGWGITYVPAFMGTPGALRNPPFVSLYGSPNAVTLPITTIADALPPLAAADPANPIGGISAIGADGDVPYVHQFNVTVQRDMGVVAASLSYVGQRGKKQYFPNSAPDFNAPSPGDPSTLQQRRPYATTVPNATNVGYYGPFVETRYHALQATLERRFRNRLGATANYTLAHAEDQFDFQMTDTGPQFLWGDSNLDLRHRLTLAANYLLPMAQDAAGWLAAVAKGWQLNLIGQIQTSVPFSVTNSTDVVGNGTGSRPNLIAQPELPSDERTPNRYFNTAAFQRQPVGAYGNSRRNLLRGPNFVQFDVSASKSLRLGNSADLKLSAQAFNVFNRTNFGLPNGVFGNPGFGTITSAHAPRQMQFAVKVMF